MENEVIPTAEICGILRIMNYEHEILQKKNVLKSSALIIASFISLFWLDFNIYTPEVWPGTSTKFWDFKREWMSWTLLQSFLSCSLV